MSGKSIIVFTSTYPYIAEGNAEASALSSLLPILSTVFDKVIVVPEISGTCTIPLPENIVVANDLGPKKNRRLLKIFYAAFSPRVYSEFINGAGGRSLGLLKNLVGYWGAARIVENWCTEAIRKYSLAKGTTVLYSFWYDANALGAAVFAKSRGYPVAAAAHGYDLFEFRHLHSAIPFRGLAMELIDAVYPDSKAGLRYLAEKYPNHASKLKAFMTGTVDPNFITSASADGGFRILSISRIYPVKRLHLILEAVQIFAKRFPARKIEWFHIGDGAELAEYRRISCLHGQNNLKIDFKGNLTDCQINELLRSNSVDVFVNFSSSEGTSAAIVEAMSVGIPVVASSVGGNTELLDGENGILLPPAAGAPELAEAFGYLLEHPEASEVFRRNSRKHWEQFYSASEIYSSLARHLYAL